VKLLLGTGLAGGIAGVSQALPYWVTPWWGIAIMVIGMAVADRFEPLIRERLDR
jgi:hypothetical protein